LTSGRVILRAATLWAALSAFSVQAGISAGVQLSAQYDSSVLPDPELTDATTQAAWGQKFSGYIGADTMLSERWRVQGRFDHSRSQWQDITGYDSDIQSGFIRLSRRGVWSPELALLAADAHVDGRDFLQLRRVSPAFGYLISPRWYLRLQGDISDKQFNDYPDRDSQQVRVRSTLYWLMDKTDRYLSLQGGIKRENAKADLYSYDAFLSRLRWKQAVGSWFWFLTLKTEYREYQQERVSLGEARQDMRWRLSSSVEWPLSVGFRLTVEAGHDIYHSNLDVADYSQNRFETGLHWDY